MVYLTEREKEVIKQLADGKTNAQIADNLCISIHTVKSILENIYLKIGFHNRVQIAIWAFKNIYQSKNE